MSTVLLRHQRRLVIRCTDLHRRRLCTLGWVNRGKRRLLLRTLTQAVPFPHHQTTTPSSSSSSGLGIRVTIKPEYRITPPPNFSFQVGDIPRSSFQFDFEFERKVLAELEKETQNWAKLGLENPPQRPVESPSSSGSVADPIVSKYIASGLSREAVPIAVANYGDNPTKVREFAKSFTQLREMGFAPNDVAEALIMYENDTDKAVAHFLNSSS
ncbi:hypothetical protein GBA52_006004 [Prunus armeniaca]|nr:hypothetical protein GBA52_006004 [Prunus armeniaca]